MCKVSVPLGGTVYLSMVAWMPVTRIEPSPPLCSPTLEPILEKERNLEYLGDQHLLELLAHTSAFTRERWSMGDSLRATLTTFDEDCDTMLWR